MAKNPYMLFLFPLSVPQSRAVTWRKNLLMPTIKNFLLSQVLLTFLSCKESVFPIFLREGKLFEMIHK